MNQSRSTPTEQPVPQSGPASSNRHTLYVVGAIVAAVAVALACPWLFERSTARTLIAVLGVGGEIFLRLLKMIVVPLVMASVMAGILRLGDVRKSLEYLQDGARRAPGNAGVQLNLPAVRWQVLRTERSEYEKLQRELYPLEEGDPLEVFWHGRPGGGGPAKPDARKAMRSVIAKVPPRDTPRVDASAGTPTDA